MAGEHDEIHVEVLHVGRTVGHGLRSVNGNEGATFVRHASEFLDGVDGAEHVGHSRNR